MIDPNKFIEYLKKKKVNLITGVPDSLLKNIDYSINKIYKQKHVISTNEGSAVALATGNYLATKKLSLVYMQNSGLGNAINPLNSIVDKKVYGIPLILLIGWRGEIIKNKAIKDEPQHKKQGLTTLSQLKNLNIPYIIISKNMKNYKKKINNLIKKTIKLKHPVAIVVRKNTFLAKKNNISINKKEIIKNSREHFIEKILKNLDKKFIVVSTTGMISREAYEIKKKLKLDYLSLFVVVGGMGHANQIAAGIARQKKNKTVLCLDGDGSVLMHLGSLALNSKLVNFKHIILNNFSHDSVGGQPTISKNLDFESLSKGIGFKNFELIKKNLSTLKLKNFLKKKGSSLLVINCKKGYRTNLGRPKESLEYLKKNFMKNI